MLFFCIGIFVKVCHSSLQCLDLLADMAHVAVVVHLQDVRYSCWLGHLLDDDSIALRKLLCSGQGAALLVNQHKQTLGVLWLLILLSDARLHVCIVREARVLQAVLVSDDQRLGFSRGR